VLVTADKNLAYQQNLRNRRIGIVVLGANRWSLVRKVIPQIVEAVTNAKPGSYAVVNATEK
jgi:hypothetical protein